MLPNAAYAHNVKKKKKKEIFFPQYIVKLFIDQNNVYLKRRDGLLLCP